MHNARLDYTYDLAANQNALAKKLGLQSTHDRIVCIGIDWNKNAGTEFYVVGYYPKDKVWIGLDAVNVGSSEFSAKRWIRELIELNYKWKPDYIYADEGYGHTVIEDIKYESYLLRAKQDKTDKELATAKIADILVSFNFSTNVKLKDPITNKDIKKTGKHFLVENAIRILQEGLFKFPVEDNRLKDQFFNYIIVKRQSNNHKPIYGKQNEQVGDHRLDAFMLALGGLVLEESVYSGKQMLPSVPTFHRTKLVSSYHSPDDDVAGLFDKAQEQGYPGVLNVLKIMRGGSEEEDRAVKNKYSRNNNNSRSINKSEESILSGIQRYSGTDKGMRPISELQHAPRRGRFRSKKRSWR